MNLRKKRVLVVEDERDLRDLISLHLKRDGYDPVDVGSAEEGLKALEADEGREVRLVVLDWMLPGMSGLDFCQELQRRQWRVPVLMVTARADSSDLIRGLEAGADDYVTKPFETPVLLARVRALFRRSELLGLTRGPSGSSGLSERASPSLRVGELVLNTETYQVAVSGKSLNLTPSEFKLLKALLQKRGKVLSRDQLIDLVQGEGVSVVDRAIDTHIFGLRKKLGPVSDFIETIRGVGYRVKDVDAE
jgi:two-component system phosphate regulon response regulator PhoB